MVEIVNQTLKRLLGKVLFSKESIRWIDYHDKIVYKYNISVHRATNKSPFLLFFGKPGFNTPLLLPEINEDGDLNVDQESLDVEENFTIWELEAIDNQRIQNQEEVIAMETIENEVLRHFEGYSERVTRNRNSNLERRRFEIGDRVMIKKDFDNNQATRRNAFDSFFEPEIYIIIEILQNNMLKIKEENDNNDIRTVFRGRVKKINQ